MKKCALCHKSADLWNKVSDVVFAKKKQEEKKTGIIIAVCTVVALIIGAAVTAVIFISKKKDEEKGIRVLLGKFKKKETCNEDCEGAISDVEGDADVEVENETEEAAVSDEVETVSEDAE